MEDRLWKELADKLLAVTKGCRPDMHEPDEQGVDARVIGTKFDNAFGEQIDMNKLKKGLHEIVVIIEDGMYDTEAFNLASLIAMARYGAEQYLKDRLDESA